MNLKPRTIGIGILLVLLGVVLVCWVRCGEGVGAAVAGPDGIRHSSGHARESKNGDAADDPLREVPEALELPVKLVDVKEEAVDVPGQPPLPLGPRSDDEILAMGGVLPKPVTTDAKARSEGVRSIKAADWKGEANLLVNALRAGDRFEVNHDELMDFLRGKDLLGWPESLRNWIGDELMTALRQDMPQVAFESLKSIEADTNAPAAMRDYSVQHLSHLVTGGVIGKEGADHIWGTLAKNDPQTLSTALISLHRLSEQVPDFVPASDVRAAAERLKDHPDERTRIIAGSILGK